jgi:hypothetical protein
MSHQLLRGLVESTATVERAVQGRSLDGTARDGQLAAPSRSQPLKLGGDVKNAAFLHMAWSLASEIRLVGGRKRSHELEFE